MGVYVVQRASIYTFSVPVQYNECVTSQLCSALPIDEGIVDTRIMFKRLVFVCRVCDFIIGQYLG
jgi:hypothetical protein